MRLRPALLLFASLAIGSAVPAAAQTAASVTWTLTSDSAITATAGGATGSAARGTGIEIRDYTGTLTDGSEGPLGPFQRWWTGALWADEAAPDPDRYVEFAAAAAAGATLRVDAITLVVSGGGTDNMRATIAYATDPAFAAATVLADVAASRGVLGRFRYDVDVVLEEGVELFVRVFPYLPGGSTSSGKYLFLQDVTIGGTSTGASAEAKALWTLDGATTRSVALTGAIEARGQMVTSAYVIRDYAGTDGSQRVYAPGGAGNGLGYWPDESGANENRYAQFTVAPREGTTLTVTSLELSPGNSGGSTALRARIDYSTDGFVTSATLAEAVELPSWALTTLTYPLDETLEAADSLAVRVYPWLVGGVPSGKYFNLRDVSISGTTSGTPVVHLPTVRTSAVASISTTTAASGGTVSSDGGGAVTARGVVWSTSPEPTLADAATIDGEGVGAYASALTGLEPGTTYYVRAYATNRAGTAFGEGRSFTTLDGLSVPTVTTSFSLSVLVTSATLKGEVTFDGGRPVTERGICVSSIGPPTLDDHCVAAGEGLGPFTVEIAGLTQETAYAARAYAVNDQGTAYGNEVAFTTAAPAPPLTIVVAQDGSGDYTTVQEAFDAVPMLYTGPVTVHVKAGTYYEKVLLESGKINVTLVGDGAERTVLTYDDYSGKVVDGVTLGTYTSYSVAIDADDFTARAITFQNTYDGSQAVALRVRGDRAAFYDVRLLGFQDTYYTHGYGRIYHQNCYIEGTVDFIFGRSIAVFDGCTIHSKRDSPITAANTEAGYAYGYVFRDAVLTADPGISSATLGRPWGPFAQTVFVRTEMGDHIRAAGWLEWAGTDNHLTATYAEGANSGSGYRPDRRVSWSHQLTPAEVDALTLETIFARTSASPAFAADWLPERDQSTSRVDHEGLTVPTRLHSIYPNPARGVATIGFDLAEPGPVRVRLYDVLGRHVVSVVDEAMPAGRHTIDLDAGPLPGGVYFVRLQTRLQRQTYRLVVVR